MKEISRRRFFQFSGAATAGFVIPVSMAAAAEDQKWNKSFDVVVIGAGGAGLAAAVTAAANGSTVGVYEKMEVVGGNTRISGGGYNAADPVQQKKQGIEDSPEKHAQQTLAAGDGRADPVLVKALADHALESLEWLKSLGVEFKPETYQIYGGLWPRAHVPLKPAGTGYIDALSAEAKKLGVVINLKTPVVKLIREPGENGRVVGVEVKNARGRIQRIQAVKGVVIASGGFAANPQMRALFDPRMLKLTTTNHPGATGDLIPLAQDVGAQTVGMDYIQCIPGAPLGDKTRSAFFNVVKRFIFVDQQGKRFIAEDQRRDVLRDAVLALPDPVCFVVIDQDGWDDMPPGPKQRCEASIKAGEAWKCDTIEELAQKMGVPVDNFVQTIKAYNAGVDAGKDALGRSPTVMAKIIKAPFYAGRASMAVHHTMGGLKIDKDTHVIDRYGKVIPGLYAAGEVTGGIHGSNRVGGNAIADIFTFGRIAGNSASKEM